MRPYPGFSRLDACGVLNEVGFAGAVLAREAEDGALELIDGELRADEADGHDIPVLVLDVDEAEADMLLASYDEITSMADINTDRFQSLLADLKPDDADLRRFVATRLEPEGEDGPGRNGPEADGPPDMELAPHEHYDFVIVLARNVHEWNRLRELLDLSEVSRGRGSFKRMGIGRGVEATKLIEMLDGNVPNRSAKPTANAKHEKASGSRAKRTGVRGKGGSG